MTPEKLYVYPPSPNSRKVMIVNNYTGLNLGIETIDLLAGDQKNAQFIEKNPNGKVPVLEFDDGSTLWESNAIMNLMAAHAKSDMWPANNTRYDILRWQFWEACHWTPACSPFISRHLFGDETVDLDAATLTLHKFSGVLDNYLNGRDWLVGDCVTTADIAVGAILYLRTRCQYPLDGFANIAGWVDRIEALDASATVDRLLMAAE